MRKNTITFIELIIIICVIVVAVRVWTPHKEIGVQPVHNIFRPTVNKPHTENSCPQCGSNKLINIQYDTEKPPCDSKGLLNGKVCMNCGWLTFKCPQCSSKVFLLPLQPSEVTPGIEPDRFIECKKCGWYTAFRAYLEFNFGPEYNSDKNYR